MDDTSANKSLDNFDKKASGVSKSSGISFGSIASAAAKLGAILTVGMGIKDIIQQASGAQKTLALMANAIKTTHDVSGMTQSSLVSLADALSKTTTFSKETTEGAENLLLTFTGIGQKIFPQTISAAQDMSTVMGTSLTSSVNILGKALSNPTKGVTALARAHVVLTAAQTDSIKKMQASGNMLGAQKALLADVEARYKGAAAAAGKTFGGQVSILTNGIKDMGTGIGMTLIPYLTKFSTFINANMPKIQATMTSVINAIVPKIQTWATIIGQIATEAFPSLSRGVGDAKGAVSGFSGVLNIVTGILTIVRDHLGLIKDGLIAYGTILGISTVLTLAHNASVLAGNIVEAAHILLNGTDEETTGLSTLALTAHTIATGIGSVATGIATVATTAFGVALDIATGPIGLVIAALVILCGGIYELVTHWGVVSTTTKKICGDIYSFVSTMVNNAKTTISKIMGDVSTAWKTSWSNICTAFTTEKTKIETAVTNLITDARNLFINFATAAVNLGKNVIGGVITGIGNMISNVKTAISNVITNIKNLFVNLATTAIDLGKNVITGIISGIKAELGNMGTAVKSVVDFVVTKFKNLFGIKSPSTVFTSIGSYLIQGLIKGLSPKQLLAKATDIIESVTKIFGGGGSGMTPAIDATISQAMAIDGVPAQYLGGLETIASHESGGNPSAQNNWDINALEGHPSQGLFQMIQSSYDEYKLPQYGGGIKNALSNSVAAIRYMIGTYGSISNVPGLKSLGMGRSYVGYEVGSRYIPSDMTAQVHQGEMIVPKSENPYANSGGSILPGGGTGNKSITVQLVLQNGKVIAEYLLDSTDNLVGNKNKISARGQGVCLG